MSTELQATPSPLAAVHDALGARWADYGGGARVPRNYGDPAAEYAAARDAAVLVDRADRAVVRVFGKDPVRMVQGLVTNDLAGAHADRAVRAAVLTPKGRMVAEVRALRTADGDVLLETDAAAREPLVQHLRKFVPPIFARFEDARAAFGLLGVYGAGAGDVVSQAFGAELPLAATDDARSVAYEGARVFVLRTDYAGDAGYDLIAEAGVLEPLWNALAAAGARPAGHATLDVLRIEAAQPRWGAELSADVIPLEAGLHGLISQTKGCYTGQEVIVRILHRGHVNRHLRALRFGDAPAPPADAELVHADGKIVGRVTSACASPRFGQTIGLGFVRREVEPPAELRLRDVAGPAVEVRAI